MLFHVNPASGLALYVQIETQVKQALAAGALKAGDALPPVRKLAGDLGINPNTVARAYQELERDGVIRTVPGGGTYLENAGPGLLKSEKLRRLRPLALQIAVEGSQLRLSAAEIVDLVDEEVRKIWKSV
jgi:GntR family transcriptional regulator